LLLSVLPPQFRLERNWTPSGARSVRTKDGAHQKRMLIYGRWVDEAVLAPVPHRQYVFTVRKALRRTFC